MPHVRHRHGRAGLLHGQPPRDRLRLRAAEDRHDGGLVLDAAHLDLRPGHGRPRRARAVEALVDDLALLADKELVGEVPLAEELEPDDVRHRGAGVFGRPPARSATAAAGERQNSESQERPLHASHGTSHDPHTGCMSLRAKAELLRSLHAGPRILVLPNAWDVASARVFEDIGAQAVATTSAGVANAFGYPDGEAIPADEMLWMVERIARAVSVPVSADLESGYGDPGATAEAAIAAGAVGLNLEDGTRDGQSIRSVDAAAAAVAAVRESAERSGVPLVINARTDVFLRGDGSVEEAAERGNAYLAAGADCVFAIGVAAREPFGAPVAATRGPGGCLAGPAGP